MFENAEILYKNVDKINVTLEIGKNSTIITDYNYNHCNV